MQLRWILVTRQEARKEDSEVGLAAAEEYKSWAGEDFKSDYSEIATVIIVIKRALNHESVNYSTCYQPNTSQYTTLHISV
jgi:hypothetical protein